ncbi:hypothetical protein RJ639_004755 [Escallonia herrerae]|uniref:sucrose synthase n=1 Tax=Escallonia herrerae TaxID=1293975 RepID=A0AA89AXM6_9ASTE|nr:hypothetical protein RJ639_004755 [Escallonia herrerae]
MEVKLISSLVKDCSNKRLQWPILLLPVLTTFVSAWIRFWLPMLLRQRHSSQAFDNLLLFDATYIADTMGAFVQPAFYEAFGLTVVEAMTCGLPTFPTINGGPAEIIALRKSDWGSSRFNE